PRAAGQDSRRLAPAVHDEPDVQRDREHQTLPQRPPPPPARPEHQGQHQPDQPEAQPDAEIGPQQPQERLEVQTGHRVPFLPGRCRVRFIEPQSGPVAERNRAEKRPKLSGQRAKGTENRGYEGTESRSPPHGSSPPSPLSSSPFAPFPSAICPLLFALCPF